MTAVEAVPGLAALVVTGKHTRESHGAVQISSLHTLHALKQKVEEEIGAGRCGRTRAVL